MKVPPWLKSLIWSPGSSTIQTVAATTSVPDSGLSINPALRAPETTNTTALVTEPESMLRCTSLRIAVRPAGTVKIVTSVLTGAEVPAANFLLLTATLRIQSRLDLSTDHWVQVCAVPTGC